MTLKWKDIKGYEGLYQIGNNGDVKNVKTNKILKKYLNYRGYLQVTLCKNNKTKLYRIHRLVAQEYLPFIENKNQVNHIDGNKLNNNVNNLEWCNSSENCKHAYIKGLHKPIKSKNNILSKTTYQYDKNNNLIKIWDCVNDIVRELNIRKQYVSACCLGKIQSTHGFVFKYKPVERGCSN